MPIIASWDVGLKNLSFCVSQFDCSGSLTAIHRWVNLTLLGGGGESQSASRCSCGKPAAWKDHVSDPPRLYCRRCASSKTAPPPRPCFQMDISGSKATVADWREWATKHPLSLIPSVVKKLTKAAIEARAAEVCVMPYKPPKSKGMSPSDVLCAMELCLNKELRYLAIADLIRIENQPYAPMKVVQMILFTLLSHRLKNEFPDTWHGQVVLANASQKTRGAGIAPGNATKRTRKLAGIERVEAALTAAAGSESMEAETWRSWFRSQAKRDDLADAFAMCLDGCVS